MPGIWPLLEISTFRESPNSSASARKRLGLVLCVQTGCKLQSRVTLQQKRQQKDVRNKVPEVELNYHPKWYCCNLLVVGIFITLAS